MVNDWDDEGSFEDAANLPLIDVDLSQRNPFDLSKALEGAAMDALHPDVKRFDLHAEFTPGVTNQKQLKN
jgi:hypothetical protein